MNDSKYDNEGNLSDPDERRKTLVLEIQELKQSLAQAKNDVVELKESIEDAELELFRLIKGASK